MDVNGVGGSGDHEEEGDTSALTVAQLHQTLVVLRKELQMKNDIIKGYNSLQDQDHAHEHQPKSFEEIFEPMVTVSSSVKGSRKNRAKD